MSSYRAAVAAIAFVTLGATGLAAIDPAAAEGVLRRGNHDEPETLDPHKSDGIEEFWVQSDMFVGLTRYDPHGKVVPDLATGWDISSDGLTWTFHLRPNLQWSDGKKLTSEDFVWSLRRAVAPATAASYASLLYPIVGVEAINTGAEKDLTTLGVEAPDPDTLVVKLRVPTAYLAGIMTVGITFPVPRQAIEAYGERWTRAENIVTDGAFTMKAWVPQEKIVLVRNPRFYDAQNVKIDEVDWIVEPDDETSLRSYRNGELDIARLPSWKVPWAKKEMPDELHTAPNLWTTYLIANTRKAPLDDVRLRQALAMAIDRDVLATRVVPHGQTPGLALIPPGIEGYTPQPPDWASLTMSERLAKAKALLAAAGYGPDHPLRLTLDYSAGEEVKRELGAMRSMWLAVGIDVSMQPGENQVVEAAIRNHETELSYYGWIADYPDPWTFLQVFQSTAGGLNTPDYRNPEFDALMNKAAGTLDPASRMALMEDGEKLIARDQPVIPISYDDTPRVVSPRVHNYFDNAVDQHRSGDIWLDPEPHAGE